VVLELAEVERMKASDGYASMGIDVVFFDALIEPSPIRKGIPAAVEIIGGSYGWVLINIGR
jgi:hypothetical protein